MLAVAKNLLIFRTYLDLTERIFRLPEFDSDRIKGFYICVQYVAEPDRD